MCEFLHRAEDWHQYDDLNQGQFNRLPERKKQSYARRLRLGDPIAIHADGQEWSVNETLPTFVKVKIPGLSVEDGGAYMDQVFGAPDPEELSNAEITRLSRFQLPASIVQSIIDSGSDFLVIATQAGYEALLTDHG